MSAIGGAYFNTLLEYKIVPIETIKGELFFVMPNIIVVTYNFNSVEKKVLPILNIISEKFNKKNIYLIIDKKYGSSVKLFSNGHLKSTATIASTLQGFKIFLFRHNFCSDGKILFKKYSLCHKKKVALFMNVLSIEDYLFSGHDDSHAINKMVSKDFISNFVDRIKIYLVYCVYLLIKPFKKKIIDNNSFKNVLLIKFDAFGDMVGSLPYLKEIRNQFPHSKVSIIASEKGAAYLNAYLKHFGESLFDEIVIWNAPWHYGRNKQLGLKDFIDINKQIIALKKKEYDLTIQFREHGISLWFAMLVSSGKVISIIDKRLPLTKLLKKHIWKAIDISSLGLLHIFDLPHLILKNLTSNYYIDNHYLTNTTKSIKITHQFYKTWIDKSTRILINVGAGCPIRMWGIDNFAHLIDIIANRLGVIPILLCGPSETHYFDKIIAKSVNTVEGFPGNLSLNDVISVINDADIVITADTGIMHLSAALNKKIISIFGAGELDFCYPLSTEFEIVKFEMGCSGCGDKCFQSKLPPPCLSKINPEDVYNALIKII